MIPENLFELLIEHGGEIVSTNSLDPYNIDQARASNRMWVDDNGLGFVWMPPCQLLPTTEQGVENFDKWFPLVVEMPEHLKSADFLFDKIPKKENKDERFKKPTDDQIVKLALIFNDGRLDPSELTNMTSMSLFVIDRLYENGDVMIPSSKEKAND